MSIQYKIIERRNPFVTLGKLGSLSIGINSTGSDTADTVTITNSIRSKTRFRSDLSLRNMLKTFQYTRK